MLSPEGEVAANVRQLFHSSTVQRASTGCLLEQVATHVIGGLFMALEAARRNCDLPFSVPPTQRASMGRAAYAVAAEGIGRVLEAINLASNIIKVRTPSQLLCRKLATAVAALVRRIAGHLPAVCL